jgi:DNA topoisomerase-1
MFRVGDEENETGTVGASTLKSKHINFNPDGSTTFNFLGKDSIRFKRKVTLPEVVTENLKGFIVSNDSTIFRNIRSKHVSTFLGEVMPGLTAKVFRTHHATIAVEGQLKKTQPEAFEPDYVKKHYATMANLQAAILCNHKRKIPKTWRNSLEKKIERLGTLKAKEKKTKRTKESIEKLNIKIKEMKSTRDYNLGTSLKSYIDPRVYYQWGTIVDYDWKKYYPKALERKFSWVDDPKYSF